MNAELQALMIEGFLWGLVSGAGSMATVLVSMRIYKVVAGVLASMWKEK